jgi:hypothetical protein
MRPRTHARLAAAAMAVALLGCGGAEPLAPGVPGARGAVTGGSEVAAPSNLTLALTPALTVRLAWQDNSSTETRFEISRSAGTPTAGMAPLANAAANATAYEDLAVTAPLNYCYIVRAVRVKGKNVAVSSFTAPLCTPAGVAAPSNVTMVVTSETTIDVVWQDNAADETRFDVYRSSDPASYGTLAGSTAANVTAYRDAGLSPATTYCYTVVAVREQDGVVQGSPSAAARCVQTLAIAPAPTAARVVSVRPFNSTSVDVLFDDDSDSREETSRVYRSRDGGVTWELASTATGGSRWAFSDVGLESERTVCYRVVNSTRTGTAEPANTMCTAPPAEPTEATLTVVDASTVDLAWRDNSAVEDGYEVRVSTGSCTYDDENGMVCDTVEWIFARLPADATTYRAPRSMLGLEIQSWRVYPRKDGGYGGWASAEWGSATP